MQSSNPVFRRSEGFNGQPSQNAYGNTTYPASGMTYPSYGSGPSGYSPETAQYAPAQRMTIDSVVQKTAITLGLVIAAAAATWIFIGDIDATNDNINKAASLATLGAIVGLVLAMVNSFKRVVSPPLVIAYALVEGVFVGAFSKIIATWVGPDDGFSVVVQAVLGTFIAFAATLAAYKFFNIQVTDRFRRIFTIALMGFVGLLLLNFVLSFFNADFGLRSMGTMGLLIGVVALVFGVISLILDFDMVERGIEAGLDERESWRAAFGLTVTLIWVYIELLRILAILRGQD
jgi:uncharacterized YccA/Bax inhibitor family protein